MSMSNKQRWMGGVILLGGGVLLATLLYKGQTEIQNVESNSPSTTVVQNQASNASSNAQQNQSDTVDLEPLAVDVETEKRLLEEQRVARERAAIEQRSQAQEAAEFQRQSEREMPAQNTPVVVDARLQQLEAEKRKAEAKLAAEQKRLAEAKAEERRQAEAKREAEQKRAAEAKREAEAQKEKERQNAAAKDSNTDHSKTMVQVSLAGSKKSADSIASKLRGKGYKVTLSPTSKGIRVMVGPESSRAAADRVRRQISNDSSLNLKNAWVIDWVPLDKR